MAKEQASAFDLKAAVAAGVKAGSKCDDAFRAAAGCTVGLHDWRMEWFAQTAPKQKAEDEA